MNQPSSTPVTLTGDTVRVSQWTTNDRTVIAAAHAAAARGEDLDGHAIPAGHVLGLEHGPLPALAELARQAIRVEQDHPRLEVHP